MGPGWNSIETRCYMYLDMHGCVQRRVSRVSFNVCQSSWLMWISFFNPQHEITVSALLWLGTRGPAKIICEKQCSNTQVVGNISWISVIAAVIWDCLSPMRLSRLRPAERSFPRPWRGLSFLLVCTADRENDLRHWGSNQIISSLAEYNSWKQLFITEKVVTAAII